MPLKSSPHIAIGRVTGGYRYLGGELEPERRHVRPVEWLATDLPRTVIKQDLLYSLGAFSTVCELSRNDAAWRLQQLLTDGHDPGSRTPIASAKPAGRATAPVATQSTTPPTPRSSGWTSSSTRLTGSPAA